VSDDWTSWPSLVIIVEASSWLRRIVNTFIKFCISIKIRTGTNQPEEFCHSISPLISAVVVYADECRRAVHSSLKFDLRYLDSEKTALSP